MINVKQFSLAAIIGSSLSLCLSSASLAQTSTYTSLSQAYPQAMTSNMRFSDSKLNDNMYGNNTKRIGNASDTASFYYRKGVRSFEKGQFEKAEYAFNAVLRADGLDQEARHYLVKINEKQGKTNKSVERVKAYKASR